MSAAGLLSERLCRRYGAIPVRFLDDTTLQVAMIDPANVLVADDLRIMTGYTIVPAIASEEDVFGAIGKLNRLDDHVTENSDVGLGLDEEIADIREMTEEPPIVKLVNSVIAQSVDDAASDIHFEPQAKELVVRFRLDGVLHEVMSVPRRMQNGVISRLKVMADLDIAERRVPQDGRIGLVVGGKPIDMRVATLPTVYGEKIVMRLLDKTNVMLDLTDLGFSAKALKRYKRSFTQPVRRHPRHRTDRLGQVDHALRHAEHHQLAREERDHRRGPGRVPPAGHQPGAGQHQGRHDLRRRRCARSCAATPTS